MKKLFIFLLVILSFQCYSQEKWRALTIVSTSGIDFKGNKFSVLSSAFHYDLNNRFFLSNWTGVQLQKYQNINTSWFSSQSTINRYAGKWIVGVGLQYGMASIPEARYLTNNSTYFVTQVSYRFKFK